MDFGAPVSLTVPVSIGCGYREQYHGAFELWNVKTHTLSNCMDHKEVAANVQIKETKKQWAWLEIVKVWWNLEIGLEILRNRVSLEFHFAYQVWCLRNVLLPYILKFHARLCHYSDACWEGRNAKWFQVLLNNRSR